MKKLCLSVFLLGMLATVPGSGQMEGINFSGLDPAQVATLAKQGSLVVIKLKPDSKLKEIVAASLVNAPADLVWDTLVDFESYPGYMPQTTGMKVLDKPAENQLVTEQTIQVEIWVLKVNVVQKMLQKLEPKKRIRFAFVGGDLPGTFGGYDLVEVPGRNQTLLFYTLYSNLTALPWPIGPIMSSQPDFLTSVNVSTGSMVVKAVKTETERRLAAGPK